MAIPTLFRNILTWAGRLDGSSADDPLQEPRIARMTRHQLADLPFGEVTFQAEPPAAAKTPPLSRCA